MFPHRLIMERSRNCPDLKSPGKKFRGQPLIDNDDFMQSYKFHTYPTLTVAMARLRVFFDGGSSDLTW